MSGAVLDRAELIDISDISCNAHDKDIADPLIKDVLKRDAGVGTAEDRHHRSLTRTCLDDAVMTGVRMDRSTSDKARISVLQRCQNFIRGAGRSLRRDGEHRSQRSDEEADAQPNTRMP